MACEPNIFIVYDDETVLETLNVLLETLGVDRKIYTSGEDFLNAYDLGRGGCLLYRDRMPDIDGLSMLGKLADWRKSLPVIVLSGSVDAANAVRIMKAGAFDLVQQPFKASTILKRVGSALEFYRRSQLLESEYQNARELLARLTARERDVLDHLVLGYSNKTIAAKLGISPRTVEIHRARVMHKMKAGNVVHLLRVALAAGVQISNLNQVSKTNDSQAGYAYL